MNILPAVFTSCNGFIPYDVVTNLFICMDMAGNVPKALLTVSDEG